MTLRVLGAHRNGIVFIVGSGVIFTIQRRRFLYMRSLHPCTKFSASAMRITEDIFVFIQAVVSMVCTASKRGELLMQKL